MHSREDFGARGVEAFGDGGRDRRKWDGVRAIWEIIDRLRGENGCPWDRKQTPASVQTYLLEEAHEASAAVRAGDTVEACEELGDLLFMVLFMIHLYEEAGTFRLEDVCRGICEKMIRRHPHVFGDVDVASVDEVRSNWERIKAAEKRGKKQTGQSVPASLPALVRAHRLLSRWADGGGGSLEAGGEGTQPAVAPGRAADGAPGKSELTAQDVGKMLLQVVDLARRSGYRAEDCLHETLTALERERNG